jgi:hypothetical protein
VTQTHPAGTVTLTVEIETGIGRIPAAELDLLDLP